MAEVLKGLTPRLADSQSNLKPLAASAIAELAASVGTDVATKVHHRRRSLAYTRGTQRLPIEHRLSHVPHSKGRCADEVLTPLKTIFGLQYPQTNRLKKGKLTLRRNVNFPPTPPPGAKHEGVNYFVCETFWRSTFQGGNPRSIYVFIDFNSTYMHKPCRLI